jgi:polar amino acid transport system substrate-binding protein
MKLQTRAVMIATLFLVAACGGPAASPGTSPAGSPPAETMAPMTDAPATGATATDGPAGSPTGDDLLDRIQEQGFIRVSTDPNYAPQSFLNEQGELDGFDVAVAREIGERLGVEVRFETPDWLAITAGSWSDRWDMSVGSMTVIEEREEVLDFTQPYYYTPAQIAVLDSSPAQTIDDLAGEVICAGEATTYVLWAEGDLTLGEGGEIAREAPDGMTITTLTTDAECAQAMRAGRTEFTSWISSSTTVDAAIAEDIPLRNLGEPVFYEPLAVAFDKSGPAHDQLVAEVDRIIGEMHSDGTLSELSTEWFDGVDFTVTE